MQSIPVPARAPVFAPPRAALGRMPDERLARLAARGSEAAFAAIFERHHQALHRYCHSIVGNGHDASDALQSTMLKAYRALSGETREITLRPWLYKIAHNESISLLRARHSDSDLDAAAHVGDLATEGLIESRDRLRALAVDLTELTEQGRGALLMRELGGLEFAEIAAALGISSAAAKQSVYESRCVLQALQEGREMDCDVVRRTLSDGDRRMLRGKRLRGHLRSCAGCHDFELALRQRPAHLAALAPPLPMAAAAAMLSGVLGGTGAGGGFGTGGGLLAALTGGAKGAAGASLTTKVATVAVVGTTIVGGGAVVVAPESASNPRPARDANVAGPATSPSASAATGEPAPRISPVHATTRPGEAALLRAAAAAAAARAKRAAGERADTAQGRGAAQAARAH
ncbi:MAG: RNA polymerase sigma factor, partial [Actinobacteria bacterium]|nr:RNA polymerase sigma factor [Actinomycetota bacterium]